jgi:hypothetical protein
MGFTHRNDSNAEDAMAIEASELIGGKYSKKQTESHCLPCVQRQVKKSNTESEDNSFEVVRGQKWMSAAVESFVFGDSSQQTSLIKQHPDVMKYHREGGIDPRLRLQKVTGLHPSSILVNRYKAEGAEAKEANALFAIEQIPPLKMLGFLNGILVCTSVHAFISV